MVRIMTIGPNPMSENPIKDSTSWWKGKNGSEFGKMLEKPGCSRNVEPLELQYRIVQIY